VSAPLAASVWGRWPASLAGPLRGASLPGVHLLPEALGSDARLAVEVAWGGTPTSAPETWDWTDVTTDVRQDPGVDAALGRGDEASTSQPANLTLTLDNTLGAYSLGGQSSNWPNVRRGTPVRVRVDPGDGLGLRVLFLGFADGFTPGWESVSGRVPVVALSASGTLRRLAQGSAPLQSAYRRSIPELGTVVAYWPMEEAAGATSAPAAIGSAALIPTDPGSITWGSSSDFESSGPLPNVGASGLVGVVPPYTATGNSAKFFLLVPSTGLTNGTVLAYVYVSGTLSRFDVVYGTGGTLALYIYNANGSLNTNTANIPFGVDGERLRLEVNVEQVGANVSYGMFTLSADPGSSAVGTSGTVAGRTATAITQVYLAPGGGASGTIMGHLTVHNTAQGQNASDQEFWAWQRAAGSLTVGEIPTGTSSRMERLCTENNLSLTTYTASDAVNSLVSVPIYERMGPQVQAPLLTLLRECEFIDQGQIWDGRTAGLAVTTRRRREEGNQRLRIDAGAFELAPPFAPVDDDQRTRNRVQISRTTGSTVLATDDDGPMGTEAIGVYDTSAEVNGNSDAFASQLAEFLVSLGTVTGYRYPTLTISARATPQLMPETLDLIPGDRVTIVDIPDALLSFPVGDVELIVEGIAHAITAAGWVTTLRCSPGAPWFAAEVAAETGDSNEFVFRLDTDGATLVGDYAAGAVSLVVATPTGPLWTTDTDDYPFTLTVGGVPVRATGCSGASSPQTFTVDPLTVPRTGGLPVAVHDPAPLAL
jgi:hypothetical protein